MKESDQQYGLSPGHLAQPAAEFQTHGVALVCTSQGIDTTDNARQGGFSCTCCAQLPKAAILASLTPGTNTAIVRGKNGATGIALVEAYNLD